VRQRYCQVGFAGSIETTRLHGDIASLKLVQPPPVPSDRSWRCNEITGNSDAQANYVVAQDA
jgi:hypothetical protein